MKSIAIVLAACAFFMTPPALSQNISNYSSQDKNLLWREAVATFNGLSYDYTAYTFQTEDAARELPSGLTRARPHDPAQVPQRLS